MSTWSDSSSPKSIHNKVINDIPAATNHTATYHPYWTAAHPIAGQIIIDIPNTAPIRPNAFALFLPCVISDRYAIATPLFPQVIPSIILEKRITRRGNIIPQIDILGRNNAHTKTSKLNNVQS